MIACIETIAKYSPPWSIWEHGRLKFPVVTEQITHLNPELWVQSVIDKNERDLYQQEAIPN